MENEMYDRYEIDINDFYPDEGSIEEKYRKFVLHYLLKIKVDPEEYEVINFVNLDSHTIGYLIEDIIKEYEMVRKKL